MSMKKFVASYGINVGRGEKGVCKAILDKHIPNIETKEEILVGYEEIIFYSRYEPNSLGFAKDEQKACNTLTSYVFDNLQKYIEIKQDTFFCPVIEYVEVGKVRCYGVGSVRLSSESLKEFK